MKLVCEGVTKIYGGKEVLSKIDLTLESGKLYGLIGRNGAGKTTLLSILSAQNPLSSGRVTLDGEPVWENRKCLEHICFARELNANTQSGLSAIKLKEYLRIARTYYPLWDSELESRLVKLFQLDVNKKLGKLSKGMLSMVTIVVAISSKAPFTFLDEPVAGLDVVAREQFYRLLLEEYAASGRTFVVSTHIIEEAADILEEVIILHRGKLLLKSDTQDLVDSGRFISGKAEDVDGASNGLEVLRSEDLGRSKAVTVILKPGQQIEARFDVSVQPVNLQRLFLALCGEEEDHAS